MVVEDYFKSMDTTKRPNEETIWFRKTGIHLDGSKIMQDAIRNLVPGKGRFPD
jgi:hypothetical protein